MKTRPEVEALKRTLEVFPALGYAFFGMPFGLRVLTSGKIYPWSEVYREINKPLLQRRGISSFHNEVEKDYGVEHHEEVRIPFSSNKKRFYLIVRIDRQEYLEEVLEIPGDREILSINISIYEHARDKQSIWLKHEHGLYIVYFTQRPVSIHIAKDIYGHWNRKERQMWLRLLASLEQLPLPLRVK